MRFSAIVPILLGLAALVLSFLCLFAGTKTTFLPDYSIITLNTSQIGENVLNSSLANSNSALSSILDDIPDSLQDRLEGAVNSVAKRLGVHDFYTANIMSFCEGYYTPTAEPNATVKASDISKNFTYCSNRTAFFEFDPRQELQRELNSTGNGNINITDLNWPSQIDDGLNALHAAQKATFILYVIGIALIAISTIVSIISVLLSGRLSAFLNVLLATLAWLAIGIASAIVTVIAVRGSNEINKYGNQIGISANKGSKFLALTWAATAAMIISSLWWCIDCIIGRRNHRSRGHYAEKPAY